MANRSTDTLAPLSPSDRSSWPDALSEPARGLIDYWVSKCRADRFPPRSAILPSEIVGILPYIFIVERLAGDDSDYRFQLVGTRIVEVEGECTGALLSDLFPDRERYADIWRHYDEACEGTIYVRRENLSWRNKEFVNYEIILLPLCDGDESIGHLIGTAHGTPLPSS